MKFDTKHTKRSCLLQVRLAPTMSWASLSLFLLLSSFQLGSGFTTPTFARTAAAAAAASFRYSDIRSTCLASSPPPTSEEGSSSSSSSNRSTASESATGATLDSDQDPTDQASAAVVVVVVPKNDNGHEADDTSQPQKIPVQQEQEQPVVDFLEAVKDAAIGGSLALLGGLRWTAANALTASLPEEDRVELLQRWAVTTAVATATTTSSSSSSSSTAASASSDTATFTNTDTHTDTKESLLQDELDQLRGSVQEEVAAAVREEGRVNRQTWDSEKERLTQQIEKAAEQRVETELAIQRQRLDEERQKLLQEQEQAQAAAAAAAAAKEQEEAPPVRDSADTSNTSIRIDEDTLRKEQERQEAVEATLQKRKQQQVELNVLEEELRKRAVALQTQKEQIAMGTTTTAAAAAAAATTQSRLSINDSSDNMEEVEAVPRLSPKDYRALTPEQKTDLKLRRDAARPKGEDGSIHHPILGQVVSDLGYKRIHLVSSGKLGTIAIWKKQRIYRNERAKRMANDKEKTMHLGFPGVICLHEDLDGKLSILDGQHRVGMMMQLREKRNRGRPKQEEEKDVPHEEDGDEDDDDETELLFDNVLVEVYPQPSDLSAEEHAEQVFLEINQAEPVKLVDMPGVASAEDRSIITEAVTTLELQYPRMFSASQRCRVPNVNVDNMRNNIFGANVLKRHKLSTSEKLVDWLLVRNAALGDTYENDPEQQERVNGKAWTKASRNGFYLGLESSWLYV